VKGGRIFAAREGRGGARFYDVKLVALGPGGAALPELRGHPGGHRWVDAGGEHVQLPECRERLPSILCPMGCGPGSSFTETRGGNSAEDRKAEVRQRAEAARLAIPGIVRTRRSTSGRRGLNLKGGGEQGGRGWWLERTKAGMTLPVRACVCREQLPQPAAWGHFCKNNSLIEWGSTEDNIPGPSKGAPGSAPSRSKTDFGFGSASPTSNGSGSR